LLGLVARAAVWRVPGGDRVRRVRFRQGSVGPAGALSRPLLTSPAPPGCFVKVFGFVKA